jgi:hypothetical protein
MAIHLAPRGGRDGNWVDPCPRLRRRLAARAQRAHGSGSTSGFDFGNIGMTSTHGAWAMDKLIRFAAAARW